MQAGNPAAQRSKVDPYVGTYPSLGAVAARFRGPNDPAVPAYVGMASPNLFFADVLGAGPMGGAYEAADAAQLAGRLKLPRGVHVHGAVLGIRHARPPENGGQMVDEIDALERLAHQRLVAHVARQDLDAGPRQLLSACGVPHQAAHSVAP